jgi:MFS transporter, DHA1 family, multidrug resistance protein
VKGAGRRNLRVMAIVVFVVFAAFAFVIPFLPLYVRALGVKEENVASWAGLLIAVAPLFAGLLAPVWGRLADRYGHKAMATRVLASYVVILALSAAVQNIGQLLALRIAVGLFGGLGPLSIVMASSSAPPGETGRAIGIMQAAQILAAAVGPFTGGLLAATIGIRPTFVVTAVLCGVAFVLVQYYYVAGSSAAPTHTPASAAAAPAGIPRVQLFGLMAVLFLVNFVSRSFTPVLPQQIERLGIATARVAFATGVLVSFYSIAAAVSAMLVGRAPERWGARRLMMVSVLLAAVLLAPIPRLSSFPMLLTLATLLGLVFGGSLTLGYTVGDRLAPGERRGTVFGYFTGAALFGGAIAPLVAGVLARWDLAGIYYVDTAICLLLAAVLALPGPLPPGAAAVASRP